MNTPSKHKLYVILVGLGITLMALFNLTGRPVFAQQATIDGDRAKTAAPAGNGILRNEVEFTGTVEAISANTWVVAGKSLTVTARTELKEMLRVGDMVRVHASTDASGKLVAREIERSRGDQLTNGNNEQHSGDDDGDQHDINDDHGNGNDDGPQHDLNDDHGVHDEDHDRAYDGSGGDHNDDHHSGSGGNSGHGGDH